MNKIRIATCCTTKRTVKGFLIGLHSALPVKLVCKSVIRLPIANLKQATFVV